MRIDRNVFVGLVTMLAGMGCPAHSNPLEPATGVVTSTTAPPSAPVPPLPDASTAPASVASSVAQRTAKPAPRTTPDDDDWGALSDVHRAFEQMEKSEPPCDRSPLERAAEQRRQWHSEESPSPVTTEAEPCRTLREPPGPMCEGFTLLDSGCAQVVSALDPAVGRKAMQCVSRLSGTRALCRRRALDDCVRGAAKGIGPDPIAAPLCEQVMSYCQHTPREPGARPVSGPALSVRQCQEVLAGVSCWSRWEAVECLTNDCKATRCLLPQRWRVLDEIVGN